MKDLKIDSSGNIAIISGIAELERRVYEKLGILVGRPANEEAAKTAAELIATVFSSYREEMQSMYDSMSIPTAAGKDLDKLAELWGINRKYMETDDELRHRTRALAVDDGYLGIELPQGLVDVDGNATVDFSDVEEKYIGPKCECGSASLGYTQPGPGHASYCPLTTK